MIKNLQSDPEELPEEIEERPDALLEEVPEEEGPPDAELVLKAQQGDVQAFDVLVDRYHGRIYGLTYNMCSNREDAEDLTQEVFVKAFSALPRFKGKSSFYTWLYRIAVNKTINYRKKRNRKRTLSLDSFDQEIKSDEAYHDLTSKGSPLRNISLSELQIKLNEALQSLSEKHRTVVVMHDMQGIPHEEIAKVVGASVGTVRSRLFYARRQMQSELAEFVK
ncbi:RNA polymerase sigma factor [Pontiella sulfatireligans]|uniref:RNA polymerase sigma factor n=1 Tax=Pontiella sulfatireligans TaxID=2750658 RepID=A0A6C2UU99_9BACT|nr:sigma-70 family RNA polymerase sigma factor [Pontiella sulfatireligans]VGO22737.1 ECF RNA polymerase sigma-E factor [Pontiella sulfatireligans]